jgi:hypothetical protein
MIRALYSLDYLFLHDWLPPAFRYTDSYYSGLWLTWIGYLIKCYQELQSIIDIIRTPLEGDTTNGLSPIGLMFPLSIGFSNMLSRYGIQNELAMTNVEYSHKHLRT